MCGIAGSYGVEPCDLEPLLTRMRHRGPDETGIYVSQDHLLSLGSVRLSIIDLADGHQPMANEDGSIRTVYNGEIYNHRDLRRELQQQGHVVRTNCDTEVIVHLYEQHGELFVQKLNGCFAMALWDERRRQLLIYRDRLGIRPLYYWPHGQGLYFASELSCFLDIPEFAAEIDRSSLDQYLSLRYVWGENSLFKGVRRLRPGHYLRISGTRIEQRQYWSLGASGAGGSLDWDEAVEQTTELLRDAVKLRLQADVPVGIYLSGGLDSGLIASLAASVTAGPLKCFSIAVDPRADDVAPAQALARRLGAEHSVVEFSPSAYRMLPEVVRYLDEPIGDIIVLPTYCLGQAARNDVKVVLTGEGADELYGGYVHQLSLHLAQQLWGWMPHNVRQHLGRLIRSLPLPLLNVAFPYGETLGDAERPRLAALGEFKPDSYLRLVELFSPVERNQLLRGRARQAWQQDFDRQLAVGRREFTNRLLEADMRGWLPDYTLQKQDRLTMANSIEGRVPYLDHRLVELAARLPVEFKISGKTRKRLLREVGDRCLGGGQSKRAKEAFYLSPSFFDASFHEFVRDTLSHGYLKRWGLLDPKSVQSIVEQGLEGGLLASKRLMAVLILALWDQEVLNG